MNKVWLFFLILLLAVAYLAAPVRADSAISVTDQAFELIFPKEIRFSLTVSSQAEITDLTLVVRFPKATMRLKPKFTPGKQVQTTAVWNLDTETSSATGGYLPPGVSGEYSWVIRDAAGNTFETSPQPFTITDNRLTWQNLHNEKISINWYGADESYGQAIFDAANAITAKLREQLGVTNNAQVQIWLYTDSADFKSSMPDTNVWTGGRSFGDYGIIMLLVSAQDLQEAIEGVRHELTHQVIYESLGSGLARSAFPHWMNEGLATYNQFDGGPLPRYFSTRLNNAIQNDTLPRLKSRDGNFPSDPEEAYLSYAMSWAIVDFLFREFGTDKMQQLYALFQKGMNADEALRQVLGVDTDGLENLWRKTVNLPPRDYAQVGVPTPGAIPTFALSSAETPAPVSGATATPRVATATAPSVAKVNTPAPANPTRAPQTGKTERAGGLGGLCGSVFGGLALAMFGAWRLSRRHRA